MDERILDRLLVRAEKGKKVYGHGVRPTDDTRQWGTVNNDWLEMAEEELLDAIMYVSADYHREYMGTPEVPINKYMLECEMSNFHSEMVHTLHELVLVCQRRTQNVPKLKKE